MDEYADQEMDEYVSQLLAEMQIPDPEKARAFARAPPTSIAIEAIVTS